MGGSGVYAAARSMQQKLQREWKALEEGVLAAHPTTVEGASYENFVWAMSMLFSRAVNLKEDAMLALVPYADLLNHSPYSNCYFMCNKIPFSDEKEVTLYADRNYAAGDQILISYGQKSNAELLLLYGFVIDRNLFDEVEISVGLSVEDPRHANKLEFLRRQGVKEKMTFPLLIDRYSSELMQYLRLCCLSKEEGALETLSYNERISAENERAAFEALMSGCESALDLYPETEEQDTNLMEDGRMFTALPRRARMAVKLRRNEKASYSELSAFARERLTPLMRKCRGAPCSPSRQLVKIFRSRARATLGYRERKNVPRYGVSHVQSVH